jgi:hypothetical protein
VLILILALSLAKDLTTESKVFKQDMN